MNTAAVAFLSRFFSSHLFGVLGSCADSAFGDDFACIGKRNLGKERTDNFINQYGKKGDVEYQITAGDAGCGRGCLGCHAQCNACLRKQSDTQILHDVGGAFGHLCAGVCARVLTCGTGEDVNHANQDDDPVSEYAQVQLCAAEDEEENEQRSGPTVDTVHQFFGEVTDVAENRAQHHAGEQRGEGDVNAAYMEGERNTDGNQYKSY